MKTAMQDLREDLIKTIEVGKEALNDIKDVNIKSACKTTLETTIKDIIRRIDNELLLMEQEQIRNAYTNKCDFYSCEDKKENCVCGLKYYERTYTQSSE
jgi:hypothetical protein